MKDGTKIPMKLAKDDPLRLVKDDDNPASEVAPLLSELLADMARAAATEDIEGKRTPSPLFTRMSRHIRTMESALEAIREEVELDIHRPKDAMVFSKKAAAWLLDALSTVGEK